jgi:hypothetical protein
MQALFDGERQAAIAAREAYFARRCAEEEEEEEEARCRPDNAAMMVALDALYRCQAAEDHAEAAYDLPRDDRAGDAYSELLTPPPMLATSDADAFVYDLPKAGGDVFIDVMIERGVVSDPHGWHRLGWIDSKKFVAWFLRLSQGYAVAEGRDA